MNELQRTFSSLFLSPLQITAALPNNFLHKPKRWLCLQKFLFEKTLSDLLHNYNLISHRQKRGKKRRQSKNKSPSPNIFKQVALLLFAQKRAFHWNIFYVASFAPFLFYFIFFGTSGTNRGEQAWRYSSVLNRCHLQITRHHPVFLCVYVCFLLTPSVLNHCLMPSFFWWGGEGKQSGDFPAAAPRPRSSGIAGARGTRLANWSNQ